jgi:hypothetical protein
LRQAADVVVAEDMVVAEDVVAAEDERWPKIELLHLSFQASRPRTSPN